MKLYLASLALAGYGALVHDWWMLACGIGCCVVDLMLGSAGVGR